MNFLFVFIIVFFVIMFFGTYLRSKKNRKETEYSSVENFHNNYIERRKQMEMRRGVAARNSNYITKYNSSEDYREK